jgi:putative lysine transport system substrate-binding protein
VWNLFIDHEFFIELMDFFVLYLLPCSSVCKEIWEEKMKNNFKRFGVFLLALCMVFALCACGSTSSTETSASPDTSASSAAADSVLTTGVLRVGMECSYAPYNWTQSDDSNGAVPIYESSDYANGYDVMMAKKICEANGWTLEVHKLDWDSIPMAVQSGAIDCGICGQSITPERAETMDFTEPYYYASIVTLTKKDSSYASATGLSDLAGATCTSQLNTVWYDKFLPQIENANILAAQETASAMLVSLESGACDLVVTDEPTALAACVAYPDLVMLDFTDTDDNFVFDDSDVNIGISIQKGNSELVEKCNSVLSGLTRDDFTEMMNEAIAVQPLSD